MKYLFPNLQVEETLQFPYMVSSLNCQFIPISLVIYEQTFDVCEGVFPHHEWMLFNSRPVMLKFNNS